MSRPLPHSFRELVRRRALRVAPRWAHRRALTLLETIIALVLIAVLLSILLPALASARVTSHRDQCGNNLRDVGVAWDTYLADHEEQYPFVALQPAWYYGGMRFSRIDDLAFPDYSRPLTQYLNLYKTRDSSGLSVCCPADRGISAPAAAAGTGARTAFESYGTSYRVNAPILDARMTGITDEPRGLRRNEITASPGRLLLCGDPVWYEVAESTGRHADWHALADAGNVLFLDGAVQFMTIRPKAVEKRIVFDPLLPRAAGATTSPVAVPATSPGVDSSAVSSQTRPQ